MKSFNRPVVKRFAIAKTLGILFGFLCACLAWKEGFNSAPDFWWSAAMWLIVFNRLLLGLVVAFVGVFKTHPLFSFPCYPWLRGAVIGAMVSIDLSIATLANTSNWNAFWIIIGSGAVFGLIIDVLGTKFGGEGEALLK